MLRVPRTPSAGAWRSRLEATAALVIIGVLVAIALPRLAETRTAAREVRLKMLLATTQSAASLFHGRCVIAQASEPAMADCARVPIIEGQVVAGVHGWPAASADGIAGALKLWTDTADIEWQSERIDGEPALRVRLKPVAVAGTCEFIYAQAASPGAAPRMELIDATCP